MKKNFIEIYFSISFLLMYYKIFQSSSYLEMSEFFKDYNGNKFYLMKILWYKLVRC